MYVYEVLYMYGYIIQFCTILKYVLFDKSKHYFVSTLT